MGGSAFHEKGSVFVQSLGAPHPTVGSWILKYSGKPQEKAKGREDRLCYNIIDDNCVYIFYIFCTNTS